MSKITKKEWAFLIGTILFFVLDWIAKSPERIIIMIAALSVIGFLAYGYLQGKNMQDDPKTPTTYK